MTLQNSDQSGDHSRLNTLLSAFSQSPLRGKSRVQIIAIGLPEDVWQLMSHLHHCGVEVPMWSPPQPIPDTEEIVLQRRSCEFTFRTLIKAADNCVESKNC